MNPTALKMGADTVAGNPALQIDAGAGLLLVLMCAVALALLAWYASGYQRSEDA